MKNFRGMFLFFLLSSFFFGNFQKIFANSECDTKSISDYIFFENNSDHTSDDANNLYKYIDNKKNSFTKNLPKDKIKAIQELNERFIKLQDEKFSISIKYVLKKFEEEEENFKGDKKTTEYLEILKNGTGSDFFLKKFLSNNKDPKNIPTSVLQNSVYLDFLIFSCELGEFGVGKEFKNGANIKDLLSESSSKEFEKKEILEKQKIVVARAVSKYQSFLTNREMYIALRRVIEKLEHLKRRFEDLARLIGFLPSKLVDFGYQAK